MLGMILTDREQVVHKWGQKKRICTKYSMTAEIKSYDNLRIIITLYVV